MARHHLDPFTVSFAEPRSKMQPQQGSIRKAPPRSILANVESDDVLAKRSANPISTCPEAGLQRADRQEQERLIKAYRAERHRLWVSQQDEQMASARYPKRALHLLVVEALGYHRQRQTSELNRKLAASIAMKHPAGIPAVLRVDPKGSSLSREVVQQIFDDVDWLVDHYGREMGMRALEQMFLWDTAPRPPSSSRTVPPKAAAPTL